MARMPKGYRMEKNRQGDGGRSKHSGEGTVRWAGHTGLLYRQR